MKFMGSVAAVVAASFMLVSCGGAAGNGGDDGGGGGGGGGTGLTGTLIGNGNSSIFTFDLQNSNEWLRRLRNTVYDRVALNLPSNELYVASLNMQDPMKVEVYNLDTFGLTAEWLWPDTVDLDRVHGLAVTPDARHAAALISGMGDTFLEVINIQTGDIVMTEFYEVASTDMRWISNTELMFAMNLQDTPIDAYGGIVTMDLAQPMSGSGTDMQISMLVGFNEAQWGSVSDYSLSGDGQQLLFSRSSELWIKDLASDAPPHQLTTGPAILTGAAFSPDDSMIMFVEWHRYGSEKTFVIPNHRAAPILIDSSVPQGREYMIDDSNLVEDILVWLP